MLAGGRRPTLIAIKSHNRRAAPLDNGPGRRRKVAGMKKRAPAIVPAIIVAPLIGQGVAAGLGEPEAAWGFHTTGLIVLAVTAASAVAITALVTWVLARRAARRQGAALAAEHALSERKMAAVVDAVVDGIVTIDPAGIIRSVNPAARRMFGYTSAELIGRNVNILMPEPDRSQHDGYLKNFLNTRHAKIIGIGREVEAVRKDGTRFPVDLAVSEVRQGHTQLFTGILRDISQRKASQAALREREARLAQLIEHMPIGAIYVRGNTLALNRSAEQITGYDRSELTDMDAWAATMYGEDESDVRRLYEADRSAGFPEPRELTITRKNGERRLIEFAGSVAGDDEVWIMRDVTEIRRNEDVLRQHQKIEALGQLTGGVAHDFNNLLSVIQGNLEMLEDRLGADAELADILTDAQEASELGAQLTQRLLAFARRQPLEPQNVELGSLVFSMADMLQRVLGEGVSIDLDIAADLWPVRADPGQVENTLINLAVNARDAMAGSGALTVRIANARLDQDYVQTHLDASAGDYVRIDVTDTGTGIASDIRDRIFEPFFTTKGPGSGTGLGLSTVWGFVKQSGGQVEIDSEVGQGTTVSILLPRSAATGPLSPDAATRGGPARGRGTILVVEDDDRVRRVAARRLISLGYDVHEADTPTSALAQLDTLGRLDLLFTDVIMPDGMNGRQLAEAVRARTPGVRVLFTSGYPDDVLGQDGILPDETHFLRKPYSRDALADKVGEILAR